jgi:calcineurin-like phosphoesterase family protein
LEKEMSRVWIISDTHFSHQNIIKYTNRPFEDAEKMNKQLIKNWNLLIKSDDMVYHLGDFAFGDKRSVENILRRLNGRKILILGNHDRCKPQHYVEIGFEWAYNFPIIYDNFCIMSHEPVFLEANSPYCNLYGHLHQNTYQSPNKNYYNCCVEQHDYKPVLYDEIKKHFLKIGIKSEPDNIFNT